MPVGTFMDFASGLGDSADRLAANDFDPNVLRPWRGADGRNYIKRVIYNPHTGKFEDKVMVTNAPATLPQLSWIEMDRVVQRIIHQELKLIADVRGAGLEYNLPNGMAHTMLQYQKRSDTTPATIGMDPIRRGENDRPTTDYVNFPLPLIWKDFDFSSREIQTSRLGNVPLDTTSAEDAAIKVAEEIEKLGTGTAGPFSFGGGSIYGLTNLPSRATKTDMPVPDGTNGVAVINGILALRQMLIDDNHRGPYVMYVNKQWPQWLDTDFVAAKGDNTLRERILAISDIVDVRVLDFLPQTKYHVVLQEMKSASVRAVVGMEVQTIQWESMGGLMKHYKILAMILLQLRSDASGNSGTGHGRTA